MTNIDFKTLRTDPSAHFTSPGDIVERTDLTKNQKLDLLQAWEFDEKRLQEAAAENMAGGESDCLNAVQKAIRQLTESTE